MGFVSTSVEGVRAHRLGGAGDVWRSNYPICDIGGDCWDNTYISHVG